MKLPIPSFFGKKEASNHYLALLLRDEKAIAVIFKEEAGKISVVGRHEEDFPTSVEHADIEEILDVLDKTISRAEETLPPNIETEKTIFGLKETWVEEGKIKKDYLAKLKKVSDELKLSPVGFLIISEAISKLIEEEEGAPLSAIITEIGKNNVTLTLFKVGRNIESHSSHIEESISKTVDNLLKTFDNVEVLPSRVIIFDGERGEEIAQQFITHPWSRSLAFLHMPQVSVVPMGFDSRAVVFGAALQMGFEVTGAVVDHTSNDIKTLNSDEGKSTRRSRKDEETDEEKVEETESANKDKSVDKDTEKEVKEDFTSDGDNFGFVIGQDIAKNTADIESGGGEKNEEGDREKDANEIIDHEAKNDDELSDPKPHQAFQSFPIDDTDDRDFTREKESRGNKLAFLSIFGGIMGMIKAVKLPAKLSLSGLKGGSKMLLIPPFIILLLIGAVLFYIFKLEATVTVHVSPKTQEENESVTFSATEENDFANSIISAKAVSTTINGETSLDTTGKKEIGEKAKGSVTIYNTSDSKKTLSAGTVVTSSNNLDFILDKDVSVASGSGSVFTGTKPGTSQVAVTAKNIGNEYNLPSNTEFKVSGNPSQIAAKNESAFSGGTKKEVRVVSKKDIEKASSELPNSLKAQAKEDIAKDISANETLLPEFTDITLSKKTFNKKEGEEAKTLTLKSEVTFEGLSYTDKDVKDYARELLKDKVDDNQDLSDETLSYKVVNVEDVSDNEMKAKLAIEAGILPKLNSKEIVKQLTGKSFSDAQRYLNGLPQVAKSDISLSPNIPFLPKILPRIGNNIKIIVDTNG